MGPVDASSRRAFAVVALALGGLAFAWTPIAERIDAAWTDHAWRLVRALDDRGKADEIVIVGVDEESVRRAPELLGAAHEAVGTVLARIAAARPRAIALDLPLPERSFEPVRAGLDQALAAGLAAASVHGLVAAVVIDARTRSAKPVFEPYIAIVGADHLAIDLLGRDADGYTRRFALSVPTEDGSFPTLVGRLCAVLAHPCAEGLIDFARGPAPAFVPFHAVREARDAAELERWFAGRIVLIGTTRRDTDRIAVPVSPARWEEEGRAAPAIAVHAQALRTALSGTAPRPLSRPALALLLGAASLLALARRTRLRAVLALGTLLALGTGSVLALRAGVVLAVAAPAAVLLAVALLAARGRPRA